MAVTKKGALQVSQAMDRLASLFQQDHAVMGVAPRIAEDFAIRLDRMSDLVEKSAGVVRAEWFDKDVDGDFDPREVGKATPSQDDDEPYVRDNFTQQEFSELSSKQNTGQLPYADVLPEQDMMGKLAKAAEALVSLTQELKARNR